MTDEEIETVVGNRNGDWWKSMAMHLREQIRFIGDELDLYMVWGKTMSDYIKREDAMKAIGNFLSREDDYFVDMAKGTIKLIPSADIAPVRHGRWEECGKTWWCSKCGFETGLRWDYCPNCGARMDGEVE